MGRPRKNPDSDVMIARDSGVVNVDGVEQPVTKGVTRARRGHAIVRAAPDLWEPINVHYEIEQATAAPGEQRGA